MYIHLSFSAPKVRRRVRSPLAGKRLLEFSCGEPRVTAAKGRCGYSAGRCRAGSPHTEFMAIFTLISTLFSFDFPRDLKVVEILI